MLEVLQFIFSSFWVWLGTVILVGELAGIFASALAIVFGYRKPKKSE